MTIKIPDELKPLCKPLKWIKPNPANYNQHSASQIAEIVASFTEFGVDQPVITNAKGVLIAGHGRIEAARQSGMTEYPVVVNDLSSLDATRRMIGDNRLAALAEPNQDTLGELLRQLQAEDALAGTGYDGAAVDSLLAELAKDISTTASGNGAGTAARPSLSDRFIVPPFSVLDARQGYWQERKRAWISLGIQSELGRGDSLGTSARAAPGETPTYRQIASTRSNNGLLGESEQARSHYKANATPGGSPLPAASLDKNGKTQRGDGRGRPLAATEGSGKPGTLTTQYKTNRLAPGGTGANTAPSGVGGKPGTMDEQRKAWRREADGRSNVTGAPPKPDWAVHTGTENMASGTSIFDPVLCELAYRWFSPPEGIILDPFAGGSVRGILASLLGRHYVGIDLRPEQIEANYTQAQAICPQRVPTWHTGDSRNIGEIAPGAYDLVFSCPPYADLEVYSDDPRDLSTMDYTDFLAAYRAIIAAAVDMLKPDRFACFVVGDIRDKKGFYRNFVSDTIAAFQDAGAKLYNEAILVTAIGSLPIRIGRQFEGYRKLGKTHQNVLVFCKGDPGKAVAACGPVEVSLPGEAGEYGEEL